MKQPFSRVAVQHNMNVVLGEGTLIMWDLDQKFAEPGPYKFRIYRGRAMDDDKYERVSDWIVNDCYGYDTSRQLGDGLSIDLWYKVQLLDGKNRVYWSHPVHAVSYWEHDDWVLAHEIVRKELTLYSLKTGVTGVLLKPRVWGEPCPCVDMNTGEVTDPDCLICYGRGIIGGYYPPMRYWCMKEPDQRLQKVDANMGLIQAISSTFRGLACPLIQKDDVLVNQLSDERWRVGDAVQVVADLRGIPIIANFPVKRIPLDDPVYRVDVTGLPI